MGIHEENERKDELIKQPAEIKTIGDETSMLSGNIFDTVREPLLILDEKLRVIKASRSFYKIFKVKPENTIERLIYELGNHQWDIPKLRELLEKILPEKTSFDNYEVEHDFSSIGKRIMLLNARQIKRELGKEKIILLAFEDVTERRREKRSLSEKSRLKSEYLNILLNHAHAPIITWDASLHIKRFNHEFEKLSGYSKSEVKDKRIEMLFPENEVDSTLELLKNNIGNENNEVIEINILTKDKKIRTVLWNSANIYDEQGKNTIATIAQDITGRKQSENALLESEIKYRTFFDSGMDAIILASPDGSVQSANQAACSMFGYSEDELIKRGRSGIVDATDPKLSVLMTERKLKGKASGELTLIRKDGTHFPAEISSANFKDHKGNDRTSMIIRDITERKKLETNLSTAAEIAKLGYWEFDVKSGNFTLNDRYYRLIHGSSTEKQGGNIMSVDEFVRRLVHPDDSKIVGIKLLEAISSPDPEYLGHAEARLFRDNGDITNVSVQIRVAKDDTGETIKVFGIDQDITEQKRFEQELIHAKEKAEESDRLKSAFLANMSHEIRTPMNGILGFSGLLKEPDLTGENQQKYIEIIEKSGARMLNIIQEIIDISKIESGQMEVNYKETNINKLIESIFNLLKLDADDKEINLSFKNSLPAKETIVRTDKEKLYSILTNLIKNAIKYTNIGSVEFGVKKSGNYLEFYVKDTGIGIPLEEQESIFERFVQADVADMHARQGAGLGLSIAKAFVALLGGKISVESELGKGSKFRFTIPYLNVIEKKEQVLVINEDEIYQSEKLKILVVDDDNTSRMLLKFMIKPVINDILQAMNGREAVEICRNNPDIDLVLMDIQMPYINGHEATRQIRRFNKKLVIIAQTAYALSGDREKALEAGCNDCISKPIVKSELYALIKKYSIK